MKQPSMILFDYGQTLADEAPFDGEAGTAAVLQYATRNKYRLTARQVQAHADKLNQEMGRFDPKRRHMFLLEVPNHMFTAYLYQSLGITLALSPEQIDAIFWDAASPAKPTSGIEHFLSFLQTKGIRTGVISNIPYAGSVVKARIRKLLPNHRFEWILTTSEYLYRKPHPRIFQLALEKAELPPNQVWYVGDQYPCDMTGAQNAGLFPVWYTGALHCMEEAHPETLTVSSWTELQHLLTETA